MTDLTFYDAAWPPPHPPAADGVCIYIGGDTPHIWTMAEIAAQTARYRLPVFTRSNPPGPGPGADVAAAVRQLHAIGAPEGIVVAWDSETSADRAYITAVYGGLRTAGYVLLDYGSQSTVFLNGNPDGYYWGADWTGTPHLAWRDQVTQYVSFPAYDLSLARPGLPFWDTRPHQRDWQEELMSKLPELRQGSKGPDVRTVQGLCVARGHLVTVDGVFGPRTAAAVRSVQAAAGITQDAVVGPRTWPALMGR